MPARRTEQDGRVNRKSRSRSLAPAVRRGGETLWDWGEGRELLGSYLRANFLVVSSCVLLRKYPRDTQSQPVLGHLRRGLQVSSRPSGQHRLSPAPRGSPGPTVSTPPPSWVPQGAAGSARGWSLRQPHLSHCLFLAPSSTPTWPSSERDFSQVPPEAFLKALLATKAAQWEWGGWDLPKGSRLRRRDTEGWREEEVGLCRHVGAELEQLPLPQTWEKGMLLSTCTGAQVSALAVLSLSVGNCIVA